MWKSVTRSVVFWNCRLNSDGRKDGVVLMVVILRPSTRCWSISCQNLRTTDKYNKSQLFVLSSIGYFIIIMTIMSGYDITPRASFCWSTCSKSHMKRKKSCLEWAIITTSIVLTCYFQPRFRGCSCEPSILSSWNPRQIFRREQHARVFPAPCTLIHGRSQQCRLFMINLSSYLSAKLEKHWAIIWHVMYESQSISATLTLSG